MRLLWLLLFVSPALAREWTRESGTAMKFQAELRGVDGPNVLLQAPDGRTASFPLEQFSDADHRFVAARLSGMVLDSMPPPNVGQKSGAGWGRPLSADPADCAVTETSDGFHSKHFAFITAEKMPPATQRDLAEACEVVHEIFRVAPWGVLATPKHEGRFRISLLPQSEIDTDRNIFDKDGTLRIPFGAAGLDQIGPEWVRDERPDAGRNLKEYVALMLQRDVIGLVPPWLPNALADCIAEIPTVGGTAWCADSPASLRKQFKGAEKADISYLIQLFTPPRVVKPGTVRPMTPPLPSIPIARDGSRQDPYEVDRQKKRLYGRLAAHYFTRLADGRRAQQISKLLRQAMEDRPKWDAYEAGVDKYKAEFEAFKKEPGVVTLSDGRYQYPSNLTPPEVPTPPHPFEGDSDQLPWLLLENLRDGRSASALADEIFTQITAE